MIIPDKAAVFSHYFLSAWMEKKAQTNSDFYPGPLPFYLRKRNCASEMASNALGSSRSVRKDVYCVATD